MTTSQDQQVVQLSSQLASSKAELRERDAQVGELSRKLLEAEEEGRRAAEAKDAELASSLAGRDKALRDLSRLKQHLLHLV